MYKYPGNQVLIILMKNHITVKHYKCRTSFIIGGKSFLIMIPIIILLHIVFEAYVDALIIGMFGAMF